MFLYPEDIDRRLNWPLGRAQRLAKRQKLPHVILPDGSIRFEWEQVEHQIKVIEIGEATPCEK